MNRTTQGLVSVIGRLFLVTIFLMSALGNKIPKFGDTAQLMEKVGVPLPRFMLVGAIAFLLVGGVSVLVGYKARVGASLLAIFIVLATYYFHAFWKLSDEQEKMTQMLNFMKNLSILGGLLLVVANGTGPFSLDERSATAAAGVKDAAFADAAS